MSRLASGFVNRYLLPAIASTLLWCGIWLITFFSMILWAHELEIDNTMAAALLTISVISAHLPKMLSLLVGTDTDFRREAPWNGQIKWLRFSMAAVILVVIIYWMLPEWRFSLSKEFNPIDLTEWWGAIKENFLICIALALLQLVFSWPEVERLKGHSLTEDRFTTE